MNSWHRKVHRVLTNHSLSSTVSQGRSNIPETFFPALGITAPGLSDRKGTKRKSQELTRKTQNKFIALRHRK